MPARNYKAQSDLDTKIEFILNNRGLTKYRNGPKRTGTDQNGQERTKTDRNGPKQILKLSKGT